MTHLRRRVALLLALGLAGVLMGAGPAWSFIAAHATLLGVAPAGGSRLTVAPTRVVLTFDDTMRAPSTIVVTGPSGRVDRGPTEVLDNTISVDVALEAEPAYVGRYRIAYRVVSADGHPVSGTSTFQYRPEGVRSAAADPEPERESGTSSFAQVAAVAGGGLGTGLVAFFLLRPRRRVGR